MVRRSGRRPGKQDTRETILAAARTVFAEQGYDNASVRRIATEARVDPALVHHYFGTKGDLFTAVVKPPIDTRMLPEKIFAGDRDGIAERMLRTLLGVWESPVAGPAILALVRGAVSNRVSGRLAREFFALRIQREVFNAVDIGIDPAEVPLRSSLVANQMFGLAATRYIIKLEPLASASTDEIVATIGPTIQRYLVGDLPPGMTGVTGMTTGRD